VTFIPQNIDLRSNDARKRGASESALGVRFVSQARLFGISSTKRKHGCCARLMVGAVVPPICEVLSFGDEHVLSVGVTGSYGRPL
jgi:hypothetical protein